ncbi:YhfL family protein [Pluralibacter gergoviae]|uniref:YhfL family protein n=1 Tax=uncultured Pluralibacter sp. TaxID=1490864 RepID=UPI00263968A8|nr:YhfL family protein [uncultured Pluralibacter sp.]
MKKLMSFVLLGAVVATLSGCTGSIYNKEKNCDYDYLFHPAISISKMIGGCGDTSKS